MSSFWLSTIDLIPLISLFISLIDEFLSPFSEPSLLTGLFDVILSSSIGMTCLSSDFFDLLSITLSLLVIDSCVVCFRALTSLCVLSSRFTTFQNIIPIAAIERPNIPNIFLSPLNNFFELKSPAGLIFSSNIRRTSSSVITGDSLRASANNLSISILLFFTIHLFQLIFVWQKYQYCHFCYIRFVILLQTMCQIPGRK